MRIHLALIALLLLTACGFRPVYGVNRDTPVGVEARLANVYIENIPDREGQFLRNALIDRFYRGGTPSNVQYRLDVKPVQEDITELDITKSSDSTRAQLRLSVTYAFTDAAGKTLLEREATSITGYNILGSEFATRVTEQDARENALNDLARQIELQLNLYFKRQDSPGRQPGEGEEPVEKPAPDYKFDLFR